MVCRMNPFFYNDSLEQFPHGVWSHSHRLGEWLRDIFPVMTHDQKVAWVELMVLAGFSHGYGAQVNYVSSDQIAGILSIDEKVLESVLSLGHARGKIDVQDKAIVPISASCLKRHNFKSSGPTWGTKSEIEPGTAKTCARYKSLLFPGMFWYYDVGTGYQSKRQDGKQVSDEEKKAVNSALLEASELLRQRLWSKSYEVLSDQVLSLNPIQLCQPEDLPESIFLIDEASVAAGAWTVEDFDKALSIWNLDSREITETLRGLRHHMLGDLLSRPFGEPLGSV